LDSTFDSEPRDVRVRSVTYPYVDLHLLENCMILLGHPRHAAQTLAPTARSADGLVVTSAPLDRAKAIAEALRAIDIPAEVQ